LISQELTDAKHQLESEVRELTMRETSLQADNERLQADLETIRQENASLGSDRSYQERELTGMQTKLAMMELDLNMKHGQMMSLAQEVTVERDAKVSLLSLCLTLCMSLCVQGGWKTWICQGI